MLVHDLVQMQSTLARRRLQEPAGEEAHAGARSSGLRFVIVGATLMISAALIGNGFLAGSGNAPFWVWLVGGLGAMALVRGVRH